jgi:putative ABC transport system permease protein
MLVATATMVEAFRTTSQRWLDYTLPFDLAVSSTDFNRALYGGPAFPAEIQDEVRAQPCVADCYGVRAAFCDVDHHNVMAIAVELAGFARAQARRPPVPDRQRFEEPALLAQLVAGEGICISDNFSRHYDTRVGDHVTLATREGPRQLRVVAIVEDYSWPRGVVFLDLATYRRLLGDTTLSYVDVVLQPGWELEPARAQLVAALVGTRSAYVFAKQDILQVAAAKLGEMMALANVQVLLALVIGFLGIVNTLLISVLERTREVGLLRAIGMTRSQVGRTVVLESLLMAAVGGCLGIAIGLAGGWYPLRLFTLQMTGYWTPAVVPWTQVGLAAVLALVIGAAAAWVPARASARVDVLTAIGYE